jgi:hypothetical protein
MQYKNFYENAKEANLRLRGTVIWYDGPGEKGPYYVLGICDHSSGDLKIYMKKLGQKYINIPSVLPPNEQYGTEITSLGSHMDKFMKDYPSFNMVRKDLSSPHFRGFRPFPLGMMNQTMKSKSGKPIDCETFFIERQPNRNTQQGLIKTMLFIMSVTAGASKPRSTAHTFDLWSEDFYACIMGDYPSIDTCINNMRDPNIANEAAAFHRNFAIVRGPIGMLFLSYKGNIVGVLDNKNLSQITVDNEFKYTKEAIAELHMFGNIKS